MSILKEAIDNLLDDKPEPKSKYHYDPQFNPDGTEKHVVCEGARYHVVSYGARQDPITGEVKGYRQCSEANCEINRETS